MLESLMIYMSVLMDRLSGFLCGCMPVGKSNRSAFTAWCLLEKYFLLFCIFRQDILGDM